MKYESITRKIIAASMKVHGKFGNGYPELIYQNSLDIEFNFQEILFERELTIPIYYRDQLVGSRIIDFLVEEDVVVEIKAISDLEKSHFNQTLNYLEAFNKEIALLINFGRPGLQFHRLINKKFIPMSELLKPTIVINKIISPGHKSPSALKNLSNPDNLKNPINPDPD